MRIEYAIIFVSDMKQAIEFYRDVVGLPLKFESPEWTEFASEDAGLALDATSAPALEPQPGESPAGTTRIGFNVADLTGFHKRMMAKEVHCVQEPMVQFGTKLAQYLGPAQSRT